MKSRYEQSFPFPKFHWRELLRKLLIPTVFLATVHSFSLPRSKLYRSSLVDRIVLSASTVDGGDNNERTLYDVLNAKPTDSTQQLRRNYRALVRQTHPDTFMLEEDKERATIEFAEIAEAWGILSNPKERLRYDRSIKAKELTNNIEEALEGGFRAAFETAYQTKRGIQNMGQDVREQIQETSQKFGRARKINELQQKSKLLNQRSKQEASKYEEAQNKLASRDRRHQWLSESFSQRQEFTSGMAKQVVQSFQSKYKSLSTLQSRGQYDINNGDEDAILAQSCIEALIESEQENKNANEVFKDAQNSALQTERKLEQARIAEQRAMDELQKAKAKLEQAEANYFATEDAYASLLKREKAAFANAERSEYELQKQQERIKDTLRRCEDRYIWRENALLKEESRRSKNLSLKLRQKAEELQFKADALQNEMDDSI